MHYLRTNVYTLSRVNYIIMYVCMWVSCTWPPSNSTFVLHYVHEFDNDTRIIGMCVSVSVNMCVGV